MVKVSAPTRTHALSSARRWSIRGVNDGFFEAVPNVQQAGAAVAKHRNHVK